MTDDEQPELPKSPIKVSDLQEEMQRFVRFLYECFLRGFECKFSYSKGVLFMKPDKKNLKSTLAGKLNLNWPYSPALPFPPR